jgi:hypothetical protein
VQFHLNAGAANAHREYILLGSVSGTEPGIPLPGGSVLPLKLDDFTVLTYNLANTPYLAQFKGTLDGSGIAAATLDTHGELPRETVGLTLNFAFTLVNPHDFVSNATAVRIVE